MRKLMLLLIAFIAVVTFIRAFDMNGSEISDTGSLREPMPLDAPLQTVPSDVSSDLFLQASSGLNLPAGVEAGFGD
jgi:hypothetical protein